MDMTEKTKKPNVIEPEQRIEVVLYLPIAKAWRGHVSANKLSMSQKFEEFVKRELNEHGVLDENGNKWDMETFYRQKFHKHNGRTRKPVVSAIEEKGTENGQR